jgi:hypothetical protein
MPTGLMSGSLTLRRIVWGDGQPGLDPEDYSVRDGGRGVGRIYRSTGGARGSGYAWFIYGSSRSGFAPMLNAAKIEWKANYSVPIGASNSRVLG